MKNLIVIRHAKSDQSFFGSDFDRPLNERGKRDAPEMAKRLLERKLSIDAFVSSPAVRAKTTAIYFAEAFGSKEKHIIFLPELYHASREVFYQVISGLDEKNDTVVLFSHNPGITDFVNSLGTERIDNMPTTGIFAVSADTNEWTRFRQSEKKMLFFDYPKLNR